MRRHNFYCRMNGKSSSKTLMWQGGIRLRTTFENKVYVYSQTIFQIKQAREFQTCQITSYMYDKTNFMPGIKTSIDKKFVKKFS